MFVADLARRGASRLLAVACVALPICAGGASAPRAEENIQSGAQEGAQSAAAFYEIETKYIFGFTEGTSIGLEGEKEVSAESIAGVGKRDGRYFAAQTKLEFEHTPSQFYQFEAGALVMSHSIADVTGLDNRNALGFGGLFGELRYLLVERTQSSPFAVTVSAEPVWRRTDETSGERVTNFELETRLHVDTELVENRLYLAFNAMHEPEWTRFGDGTIAREVTLGLSGALAYRPAPPLLIGAELWYLRHYDDFGLSNFTGDAVFLGPTLYLQLTRKSFMTAAWGAQIAGHQVDGSGTLNLTDFARHRAKLKFAVEF
jgi:hypothetical protein